MVDGIDIEKLDKKELREHISIVLQDVFLFSGNIESNINLDKKEIPREKILEAAKIVGA